MSVEKQRRLVDMLIDKTESRSVVWNTTYDETIFQAVFGSNILEFTFKPRRDSSPDYIIRLVNENGSIVDQFSDVDINNGDSGSFSYFSKMKNLYDTVRRQASGADDILNDILGHLGSLR